MTNVPRRHRILQLHNLFNPILIVLLCSFGCNPPSDHDDPKPPNILLIISDDQGWSDYGFMSHPHIETPNIDRLAEQSLTFTRGYVAAPLCSPSLASIITGLYPHEHGITGNDPDFEFDGERWSSDWNSARIPHARKMIDDFKQNKLLTGYLSPLGYQSLQTGKWWMGSWKDGQFSNGMTHGDGLKGGRHGDEGLSIGREGLQPIYDFIDDAQSQDKPFFIWYAPFLPHTPHTPPRELEDKYLERAPTPTIARYWAMCEWFDQTCGALLQFLDRKDLSEETMVIYVCDNGWIQQADGNGYAPRSKRSPYDMGIRTPLMFKWPGKTKPRIDTTTLVSSIDIVPTVLAACDLPPDGDLQGLNLLDPEALKRRETVFAEALAHDIAESEHPTRSLQYRMALSYPWKLISPDTTNLPNAEIELFDLVEDPGELNNLAEAHPEMVKRLQVELDNWWVPDHFGE